MKYFKGISLFFASLISADARLLAKDSSKDSSEDSAKDSKCKNGDSIADIASGVEDLSTLVSFVDAAGLVPVLDDDGTYTVFAPVNEAFEKLPAEVVEKYQKEEWKNHLQSLLLYHVLGAKVFSTDLSVGLEAPTLEGNTVEVTSLSPVTINDSEVLTADIKACNGVVHVVDTVLLPPSATDTIVDIAVGNPDFSTLVDLLGAAGLVDVLQGDGPFTVFAPTNEAFSQLPKETVEFLLDPKNVQTLVDVLTYHVVSGIAVAGSLEEGQKIKTVSGSTVSVSLHPITINNALVTTANILASNGVIHVIDSVLLPPTIASIADIIKSDDTFSTLASLVDSAGLTSTLEGDGPFTLFAPINRAFEKLPSDVVETITGDETLLTNVLTYHVIPSEVLSTDLEEDLEVETAFPGNSIEVTSLHPPKINKNAYIAAYDILATNGVVHVITSVLVPEGLKGENGSSCSISALCQSNCCAATLFAGKKCADKKWLTACVKRLEAI